MRPMVSLSGCGLLSLVLDISFHVTFGLDIG